jgi:hypothetical protein
LLLLVFRRPYDYCVKCKVEQPGTRFQRPCADLPDQFECCVKWKVEQPGMLLQRPFAELPYHFRLQCVAVFRDGSRRTEHPFERFRPFIQRDLPQLLRAGPKRLGAQARFDRNVLLDGIQHSLQTGRVRDAVCLLFISNTCQSFLERAVSATPGHRKINEVLSLQIIADANDNLARKNGKRGPLSRQILRESS